MVKKIKKRLQPTQGRELPRSGKLSRPDRPPARGETLKNRSRKIKRAKKKLIELEKFKKLSFLEGPIKKAKIKIVGIGGGGSSIVSEIFQRIPSVKKKISFLCANTDLAALRKISPKIPFFHFGKDLTSGLGTGMNTELARKAAKKEKEKISKILKGQDLLILIASLGGGVGSGAAPFFAKVSKDLGNLTYGIFTLPFKFEGQKRMEIAKNSLRKLKLHLDSLTIVPNENIFQLIDKKTPITEALSIINKNLAKSIEGLLEIIYQPGLINIDFADLKTIFKGQGKITYLNTLEFPSQDQIQEALKKLIFSPLYPYSISGAKGILFNIAGSNLKLSQVNEISKTISNLVGGEAKIIFGISENKELKDKIKITLLATGCKFQFQARKKIKEKKIPSPKKKIEKKKIKINPKVFIEEKKEVESSEDQKIRRNALQVKEVLKEEEKKILEREKFWETPAFLRLRPTHHPSSPPSHPKKEK